MNESRGQGIGWTRCSPPEHPVLSARETAHALHIPTSEILWVHNSFRGNIELMFMVIVLRKNKSNNDRCPSIIKY